MKVNDLINEINDNLVKRVDFDIQDIIECLSSETKEYYGEDLYKEIFDKFLTPERIFMNLRYNGKLLDPNVVIKALESNEFIDPDTNEPVVDWKKQVFITWDLV